MIRISHKYQLGYKILDLLIKCHMPSHVSCADFTFIPVMYLSTDTVKFNLSNWLAGSCVPTREDVRVNTSVTHTSGKWWEIMFTGLNPICSHHIVVPFVNEKRCMTYDLRTPASWLTGCSAELWVWGFVAIYHRAMFRTHLHEGWLDLMNMTCDH